VENEEVAVMGNSDRRCINLKKDRLKGADAEERFCELMRINGFKAERLQPKAEKGAATKIVEGRRIVVGDVDITLPNGEVFNAEVKSKYPNRFGAYGIEEYRVKHYINYEKLTGIPVVYVIEKTKNSRNEKEIPIEKRQWLWKSFRELLKKPYKIYEGWTWISGQKKWAPIYYFKEEWFNNMETDWWE
jgi:hypothetical protein